MKNITIKRNENTIVISKDFDRKASVVGSVEYNLLLQVQRDYPDYNVVVKRPSKRDQFKGLTFEYMKNYIEKHPDKEKNRLSDFLNLTGQSDEAKSLTIASKSYGEVKEWFLNEYPEFNKFLDTRDKSIKDSRETARKRKAEAQEKAA